MMTNALRQPARSEARPHLMAMATLAIDTPILLIAVSNAHHHSSGTAHLFRWRVKAVAPLFRNLGDGACPTNKLESFSLSALGGISLAEGELSEAHFI